MTINISKNNNKIRDINGIVLLNKSQGISSNYALQQVKRLFCAKKAGHTGSLDPLATGILPICLGQATKIAQFMLTVNKQYFVRAKLGYISNTGDAEGEISKFGEIANIKYNDIDKILKKFIGKIEQIPPMYSALKQKGIPLYKMARKGIQVKRDARKINIYDIKLLNFEKDIIELDVYCSKGTYIRTLIEDIGKKIGSGAYVIKLNRIGFAHLKLDNSFSFEQLENKKNISLKELDKTIINSADMLPEIDSIYLNDKDVIDIKFGRKINNNNYTNPKVLKLFDNKRNFLGIGESDINGNISPKRIFV